MAKPIPLDMMSTEEKLKAMESLWDDLCSKPESVKSPDWHGEILVERQNRYQSGDEPAVDWETAKLAIRDKLK